MDKATIAQQAKTASSLPPAQSILQRKCACGNHTVAGGECAECAKNQSGLQRKVTVGASNDPLEREADRVAAQVMAAGAQHPVSGASRGLQRYAGQATEGTDPAPASVGRVLSDPGRPLDPALRQDMEQRFGHDFSRVRVHAGTAAEQSARDVNANAYTVGPNIVFGASRFSPATSDGRRLIAHELTHVVQQSAGAAPSLQRQPDTQSDDSGKVEAGDTEADDPIDDYETGADNEVAPEKDVDTDTDAEESFAEEPEPLQASPKPPTSGKWILVKLPGTLIRFEGSKRISSWGISGGRAKNPTPEGSFSINDRDENHTSNSYGTCDGKRIGPNGESKCKKKGGKYVGADMHFFQQFAPSVGFHRGDPNVPSHGCIHVNAGNAATLWNWAGKGTPVVVCSGSGCDPFLGTSTQKKKKQTSKKKKTD